MKTETFNASLFSFLENSPTAFHAVSVMKDILIKQRFVELNEGEKWLPERGKRYFVIRDGALIAFTLGQSSSLSNGFRIIGAHTDSPCLQIKPNLRSSREPYLLAGIEKYGGALLNTWFDRELSLAGRVSCSLSGGALVSLLIDFKKPLLYIPSLAIHLNRKANEGQEINAQSDLSPILGQSVNKQLTDLKSIILDQVTQEHPGSIVESIFGFDLFCYDPNKPSVFGIDGEFLAAPRLDNLLSCHTGIEAICQAGEQTNSFLICTNHEEVGSTSSSGALGNFPDVVFSRIISDPEERAICLHNSFLLSLDNAHATHPNFKDKSDDDHQILLNQGPVIKINASQRYSSTSLSASLFRLIASEVGLNTQDFVMRSDMACGSTIGPLTSAQLGISAVDIGAPTWGMHSIREVTGTRDPTYLYQATCHFLNRDTLPPFKI